jgi:hypothetical protein
MADDKTKRGGQDRSRINLHEDYEVRHWTKKFRVTKEELERAVKAAGSSSVQAVERELSSATKRG